MLEERARPLRTRLTRIRAMNNAYYRPLITIFLSFRFLSKREPISRSVSPSRKDSARISRGFRAFNPPPRSIGKIFRGETILERGEDARIESASASSAFLRTCAHACAAYRRPRIRDNVIDDDIERRSSRSRAFHRPRLPSPPHRPRRYARETSFPINSCTDANGRLSPLDINDG